MICDLHMHSTASDGQYSPSELVCLAKKRGLEVIALTDHDTIDGLDEAIYAGEQIGIKVLRGVELGASEHRNLHILGYGFSHKTPELTELCKKLREGRNDRKYRIIDFLREKGVDVPLSEVEEIAGGDVIARPHFAQALLRHGYVSSIREAFALYLDTDEYQRIERFKADANTCISTIKSSGGKVALAHPYQIGLDNEKLEELILSLVKHGLDAIECYYPIHTDEQTAFYLRLAKKYGLYVTGGSDFHGERVKPDISIATWDMDVEWLL